MNNIYYLFLDK